jgi:alkylation response protein AidB-like acyl-CoA dehydrogenase
MVGECMSANTILDGAADLAREWAAQCPDRQQRTQADPEDFEALRRLGIPLLGVPAEFGGLWESPARSSRPICTMLRVLAQGDPSVTLASSMHQLVLASWRTASVSEPYADAWARQRKEVFQTVHAGAWWGTLISEPGSGGDSSLSSTDAVPAATSSLEYRLSGRKHFGSGSGITSYMITRAVPEGETETELFYLKVGDVPWDGSTGMKLASEWRGHGMMSTNSHAFEFHDFPATRAAAPSTEFDANPAVGGLSVMTFTSVIVGVVDAAMNHVRARLGSQGSSLRSFQQVEWTNAEQEAWLIEQAWEGAMRTFEQAKPTTRTFLLAKQSVARLAESVLDRLCRITGGSSYTWYSPLGAWWEDVRALGYLRPPWSLAFDQMYQLNRQEYGLDDS